MSHLSISIFLLLNVSTQSFGHSERLFGSSQTRESYLCPGEAVEFICNIDDDCSIISFWIIDGTYFYWQDSLPDGHTFRFPSTLYLDAENYDLNMTTYQCSACNDQSSIITLVILGSCPVDVINASTRSEAAPTITLDYVKTPIKTHAETSFTYISDSQSESHTTTRQSSVPILIHMRSTTVHSITRTPLCDHKFCMTSNQDKLFLGGIIGGVCGGLLILWGAGIVITHILHRCWYYYRHKGDMGSTSMYEEVQLPETSEPVYSVISPISDSCLEDVKMDSNKCYTISKNTQFKLNDCPAYEL